MNDDEQVETTTVKQSLNFKRTPREKPLTAKRVGEQLGHLIKALEWFHTNEVGLEIEQTEAGFSVQCNVDEDALEDAP